MPLIMEEGINVDDLFGEPNSLGLGLPPVPPSATKGLAQCLDEMRLLGCRQKIIWSRVGCVAYISPDGIRVSIRHLQCRPLDGKWQLSEEETLSSVTDAHGGIQLVHLSFNETGTELAVVDCLGRVSIHSLPLALNGVSCLRQASFDSSDDSNQIVGMMWLNTSRSVHAFHQAAKLNGRWAYSPFRRRPIGPFHPAGKGALLCVTRAGQIRLLYQNPDGKWAELPAELKNTGDSDRLLTHAAMVATQAGILIATYSVCQKICLYRVQITWNPPQWDPSQAKHTNQFPVPAFRFLHCKIDMPSSTLSIDQNSEEHADQSLPFSNSVYSLTRLEIMQGQIDSPAGSTASPWIMAVFSKPLHATPEYPEQQGPPSVIARWNLESAPQALHPKFDEVTSKKNNGQAKSKMEMRRLEDIHCDKYIVSVDHIEHGNALAVTHDDSSVTFYDTRSMAIYNGLDDSNMVTSLAQAGFQYPLGMPGVSISFSPSSCAAITLDVEGQPRLRLMEHSFGSSGGLYDESKFSAAIAALTLAYSRGCGGDANTDDVLMVGLRQLSSDAQATFVSEVFRALPINCNYTTEQEKLLTHPYISRCMSLPAALGNKGRLKRRNVASAVPWTIIQLRHASLLYAYFFQNNKGGQGDAHDSDILRMILGNARWSLSFLHFILSEIFDLAEDFESVLNDQEAFTQKLKTTKSLALVVLLSSMSRAFLRFICRGLRGVHNGYLNTNPAMLVGDLRTYYTETCQTIEASPVPIEAYEKFLSSIEKAVKHAYEGAGFGDAERPGPEKELLVNSRIPPVLVTAATTLLRQTVPTTKAEIDRKDIVLGDYAWLGFGDDARTAMYRRHRDVDILKKFPLRPPLAVGGNGRVVQPQKRRRCVRCGEVTGEVTMPRSLPYFRLLAKLGVVRSCPCGGMWVFETEGVGSTSGVGGVSQSS